MILVLGQALEESGLRLVEYTVQSESRLGVVMADRIVDVRKAADSAGQDTKAFTSTLALLEAGDEALAFAKQHCSEVSTTVSGLEKNAKACASGEDLQGPQVQFQHQTISP